MRTPRFCLLLLPVVVIGAGSGGRQVSEQAENAQPAATFALMESGHLCFRSFDPDRASADKRGS
jgi:hypothetical protein